MGMSVAELEAAGVGSSVKVPVGVGESPGGLLYVGVRYFEKRRSRLAGEFWVSRDEAFDTAKLAALGPEPVVVR